MASVMTSLWPVIIGTLGVIVAAYAAYRGSKASADASSQSAFLGGLQAELGALRARMAALEERVQEAESESRVAVSYIERLLFWIADKWDDPSQIPPIPEFIKSRITFIPGGRDE